MTTCKTGAEHIKSLQGRPHRLYRRQAGGRRHGASGVPQFGAIGGLALRFPGAAREHRADDLHAGRRKPPHQSRLADAAQLRRDGAAPQGDAGLGRSSPTASWAARPITSPRRWSGSVWASRSSRSTAPARAKALRGLLRGGEPQRLFPHLRDHQSAGRARQGLGRAGRRPGRRASSTRTPAASRSAAPRCSAPARSWRTRCSSRTCSR